MSNFQIRNVALKSGVKLWEIAEQLGITDSTFSRKLRRELPEEEREKIIRIIDRIAGSRKEMAR